MVCLIIYAINYGLGVFGPDMAMDFGSIKWNRCLVSGLVTPKTGVSVDNSSTRGILVDVR